MNLGERRNEIHVNHPSIKGMWASKYTATIHKSEAYTRVVSKRYGLNDTSQVQYESMSYMEMVFYSILGTFTFAYEGSMGETYLHVAGHVCRNPGI